MSDELAAIRLNNTRDAVNDACIDDALSLESWYHL